MDSARDRRLEDAHGMMVIYRNLLALLETRTPPANAYHRSLYMENLDDPSAYRAYVEERLGYWTGVYISVKSGGPLE